MTRQQMRNCLYCGQATLLLKELSQHKDFVKATGQSLNWKTMRDREFVNRFLGFYLLGPSNYKGYMDNFLAEALTKVNDMKPEQLSDLKETFLKSMRNNYAVFGKHSFRKHNNNNQGRNVINAALFDIFSVIMANMEEKFVVENKDIIHEAFYSLISYDSFVTSITYSTNDLKHVLTRFRFAEKSLGDLHAHK